MKNPIKIIQISDTHLFADQGSALLGVNTFQSLQAVLDLIRFRQDIDLIIFSGDISQDGTVKSYQHLDELLRYFPIPTYYFPGNHDNLAAMHSVFPHRQVRVDRHIVLDDWQIVLLDSQKPNAVEGYLDASQFEFLATCLTSHQTKFAIVMFHHHPVPVKSAWLDRLALKNADVFWTQIKAYPMVKAVIYGHVHQENEQITQGIACYSVPSTCVQFKRESEVFALENLNPGCRIIHLFEDGTIKTEICRTDDYVGFFDPNAKGY